MTATLLFLPAHDEDRWRWLRLDDDAEIAEGEGVPSLEGEVIAVAPAADVSLHWAELPARSPAQAAAAARIVVSDATADPVDSLHVAVGEAEADARPIGVVSHARMRDWLGRLALVGLDPAVLVPAPLLLPAPADGYLRADIGGESVVRGPTSGFADEARLTALVTGGATPETVSRSALAAAIASSAAQPLLNLRQGPFAKRRRRAIDWALVRRLAVLGGLILLATLAIDLVRIARFSIAADTTEARADALARQGLPRGADAGDPARLLTERLSRLRGPGAGFSATAAAVIAAIRGIDGTEASALAFEPNGDLRVTVTAAGEAQANALVARLRDAGFAVQASTFEASGGRLKGELTVTLP